MTGFGEPREGLSKENLSVVVTDNGYFKDRDNYL